MARLSKKGLWGIIIVIVVVVLTGGYFFKRSSSQGMAARRASGSDSTAVADSLADSTLAEADTTSKDGDEDSEEDDEKKEPDPVPIEVALVNPRRISAYYYTTATLEPERKVDVLAKTAGEVSKLHVEEGALVKQGDLLCELEDSELKISLDEARINMEQQEREFARIESMHDESLISDKEYSDAKYQYELAKNRHAAAAVRYGYTKVKAPFGGVVTLRYIELGQNLNVASQVFQLVDPDPLLIRTYLPENEIAEIEVGQKVSVEPDSDPDNPFYGKIIRIAPDVDDRTGTVKVTAETHAKALPGSFARVKIITDTRQAKLTIPRRGIVADAGELYVFVAEGDTVRKSPIQIGYQDEDYAEVLHGVENGDSVVVVGVGGLRTGTKIKVLEPNMQDELTKQGETDDEAASN
ncbi:MAG: efflux RND transporter periplasmic adaptor subunit [Candidatus Krumholzibacteria bacterium]|nr:efflux RND transporter periplasmic adaptor subunit [Candidatus Krumholzibacteria bacterium]